MDLHIGTWAIPALITIGTITFALFGGNGDGKAYGYTAAGQAVISLLFLLVAIIVSLIAWLVWAVLT